MIFSFSLFQESQSTTESARLKVDGILKAKGLGRSTENLLDIENTQETTSVENEQKNEEEKTVEDVSLIQNTNSDDDKLIEVNQEAVVEATPPSCQDNLTLTYQMHKNIKPTLHLVIFMLL